MALGLSKLSVALLLFRLTSVRRHKVIFMGVMAFITTWTIAAAFAVALQCNLAQPWITIGERCTNLVRLPHSDRIKPNSMLIQLA